MLIEDPLTTDTVIAERSLRQQWEAFRSENYGSTLKLPWLNVKGAIASHTGLLAQFASLDLSAAQKQSYEAHMRLERLWCYYYYYYYYCSSE